LLGDFGVGERRQEGEGLEHPNRGESKGEEERDIGQSSRSRKIDSSRRSHPSTEREEATRGHSSLSELFFFDGERGLFQHTRTRNQCADQSRLSVALGKPIYGVIRSFTSDDS
jgi:hypothetical protein